MFLEPLRADNTTIILIDYGLGFGNLIRSHPVTVNIANAAMLAETAKVFRSGLVVTNGPSGKASGPFYHQLLDIIDEEEIVVRGGMFNAFLFDEFKEAVANTGRKNIVIAGLMTEGCVLQTVLGALREGYTTYCAVDACGGMTKEVHLAAIERMKMSGAAPVSVLSLASEFLVDQALPQSRDYFKLMDKYVPEIAMVGELFNYAQAQVTEPSTHSLAAKLKETT